MQQIFTYFFFSIKIKETKNRVYNQNKFVRNCCYMILTFYTCNDKIKMNSFLISSKCKRLLVSFIAIFIIDYNFCKETNLKYQIL